MLQRIGCGILWVGSIVTYILTDHILDGLSDHESWLSFLAAAPGVVPTTLFLRVVLTTLSVLIFLLFHFHSPSLYVFLIAFIIHVGLILAQVQQVGESAVILDLSELLNNGTECIITATHLADWAMTLCYAIVSYLSFFAQRRTYPYDYGKQQFIQFYQIHNPKMLDRLDELLDQYAGSEDLLMARLKKKYESKTIDPETSHDEALGSDLDLHVEEEDDEDEELTVAEIATEKKTQETPQTPTRKALGTKKQTTPESATVSRAREQAQAAQQARIEERIQQIRKRK